ncbi:MAG: restriction endonuclease subunit S [Planctomycetes bacterium]|nr:restriction endonuclease subunit S [Planctomycetota bacterium]
MSTPNGWTSRTIGSLTSFLNSGISRPFVEENIGLPVLRSNNVQWGRIVLDDIKYWHEVDPRGADLSKVVPHAGDILINFVNGSRTELGKAAHYKGELSPCIASTNFFIVRFDPNNMLPTFANYYFQSQEYRRALHRIVGFTGQGSFNKKELGNTRMSTPPLDEQRRIAEILGAWDEAIEKVGDLIQAKLKLKRGLMQKLFPAREEGQWVPLKKVAKRLTRKVGNEAVSVLSITATVGFVDQAEKFSRVIAGAQLERYTLLKKGEFAYNKGNSKPYPQGCIYRLREFERGAVPHVYFSFAINNPDADPEFYRYYFEAGGLNRQLCRMINAGVRNDGLLNLNADDFFKCKVPQPSLARQQQLATMFATLDNEIDALKKLHAALDTQKRGLMQQLLTGKKRVKVDAEEAARA